MATLTARLVGGPTAVLEYGGRRWVTDPALSPPGEYEGGLVKTTGPAFVPDDPDGCCSHTTSTPTTSTRAGASSCRARTAC